MNEKLTVRITYEIDGVVQGVGFRPTIYRLANQAGLGGWVQNRSGAVQLCLEGTPEKLGDFITQLHYKLPPQASINHINQLNKENISASEIKHFEIIESESDKTREVVIPADLAICKDCEKEILDPENRRYAYPFTTCTNCGPRYTVVNDMPYDRERTTLNQFPLCEKCLEEYEDPENRRFHAESIACPVCGPRLSLVPGKTDAPELASSIAGSEASVLEKTRAKIADGDIIAIRGIGGYLLACDAFNSRTIQNLRKRKNRPAKPFAVMFRNIETLFKYCKFDPEAVKLLISPEAPIVIMDIDHRLPTTDHQLPITDLSPDSHTLGAMVPYSPLHKLLFEPVGEDSIPPFEALVMTSGNRGGEPICITNQEAFERLEGIADCFLTHNREINLRNDDSLCIIQLGKPQIWRRARGYAPKSIKFNTYTSNDSSGKNSRTERPVILAMGAELKNTIAVAFGEDIIMSPHIGDLEAPEAVSGMEQVIRCFPKFLDKKPDLIAVDIHPDMQSTRIGKKLAAEKNIPLIEVQHHHAHAAACMAEHGLNQALALSFDGTGLGPDNTIWGAECMAIDFYLEEKFQRIATFAAVPLPGGDAAVYNPIRQLAARYHNAGLKMEEICIKLRNYESFSNLDLNLILTQCEKGINAPLTHAAGRLFDSISIMLEIAPEHVTYEGQSAISLEGAAKFANTTGKFKLNFDEIEQENMLIIDWKKLFSETPNLNKNINEYALAFHYAVADAAFRMIDFAKCNYHYNDIVLTGGVFMNRILTKLVYAKLTELGFNVYIHRQVPPNDGGIAFGQAVIGMLGETEG